MNKILLIVIIILFSLGFSTGYYYATSRTINPLTELEKSRVILNINARAYGRVVKIEDRNITIENGGHTKTIIIKEQALVNRLLPPENIEQPSQLPLRETITFEEIKVDDVIYILSELEEDGSLEGIGVDVLVPQ